MQAAQAVEVKRELHLFHPLEGERVFSVGVNCESIERADGGYEVHKGSAVLRVEDHRVDHFKQDPRPGFAQEQRDASSELPSYAEKLPDGMMRCRDCGAQKKTLHALRIHHGKAHP